MEVRVRVMEVMKVRLYFLDGLDGRMGWTAICEPIFVDEVGSGKCCG